MNFLLHVHALTVTIAVSYLTLVLADTEAASQGPVLTIYAVVMVILTVTCLSTELRHRGS